MPSETPETYKNEEAHTPQHWLLRDLAQTDVVMCTFFLRTPVLEEVRKTQKERLSLFLRMFFQFNYQFLWNLLDQRYFKNI